MLPEQCPNGAQQMKHCAKEYPYNHSKTMVFLINLNLKFPCTVFMSEAEIRKKCEYKIVQTIHLATV